MKLSRRQFFIGSGVLALPVLSLPVRADAATQPYEIGEVWGMPFVARGADPAHRPRRHRRANIAPQRHAGFG
jgi:hypothetical protein